MARALSVFAILSFVVHPPVAADTNPGEVMYAQSAQSAPRYRTWDGSSFGSESNAQTTATDIHWIVAKPSTVGDEIIMGVIATNGTLYIQTWDGSSWTSNWNTNIAVATFRRCDIAYERTSGDAVVVFGDDGTTLMYRKRVSGTWDSTDQTLGTLNDKPNWIRLGQRPTNDDLFVGVLSASKAVEAWRWNGSSNSWGDFLRTTADAGTEATECFDVTFERCSGDAFLLWGDASNNVKSREFTTSWQSEQTAYSMPDAVEWLVAAHDPKATNDDIAIGMTVGNSTLEFGAWNGSSWATRPSTVAWSDSSNRTIDVAFETSTGKAVWGFATNSNTQQFSWRTWTSSGGFSSVTTETGNAQNLRFVQLRNDPFSDDIMALYSDSAADLFHRHWDGSAWSSLGTALEASLQTSSQREPFAFAWESAAGTAVTLRSSTATAEASGVVLRWRTSYEVDNLGFHAYREGNGRRVRVTPSLVAGSALQAGAGTALTAGLSYAWVDPDGTEADRYWLEDVDLSGRRTWHGPVVPGPATSDLVLSSPVPSSRLLNGLAARSRSAGHQRALLPSTIAVPLLSPGGASGARERQWDLAAAPALKMRVREEGWYRVDREEWIAAGLSPQVDPRRLQLFTGGEELAVAVVGEEDGSFDPGDAVEFYGRGLETAWTDVRTYWLVVGAQRGRASRGARRRRVRARGSRASPSPWNAERSRSTLRRSETAMPRISSDQSWWQIPSTRSSRFTIGILRPRPIRFCPSRSRE